MRNRTADQRWEAAVLAVLVLIPIAFNAIMLLPEVRLRIPSFNDDAFHFMFVQRASAALTDGANPFDFWVPNVGLGFPQFLYYQHLPHLAVVALHRLLLTQVDLLTLFNLVRYLLMVGFPLTVYWSMRTMEFSAPAAATAAACASLLAAAPNSNGFEYESYISNGSGMYTQLWAMHLLFIVVACLYRLLAKGEGYLAAIIACSALVLSHLLYAYLATPTAVALLLASLRAKPPASAATEARHSRGSLWPVSGYFASAAQGSVRFAIVAAFAAAITCYLWLPLSLMRPYFDLIFYHDVKPRFAHPSFLVGVAALPPELLLLDYARIPTLTLMAVAGVWHAVYRRTAPARLTIAVLGLWLGLYVLLSAWPDVARFLPMHDVLVVHRLTGAVDLGAMLAIGLAGDWLWQRFAPLARPWRAIAPALIIVALIIPALRERFQRYQQNTAVMENNAKALDADPGFLELISTLRTTTPARAFFTVKSLRLILPFYDIVTISPGQVMSLNSTMAFNYLNPADYNLFNARYVVAPSGRPIPRFLTAIRDFGRFSLYSAETGGYARFAALRSESIESQRLVGAQLDLEERNAAWMRSGDPAAGQFIRWNYPPGRKYLSDTAASGGPDSGTVTEEHVSADRFDFSVDCRETANLVIKVTYHPNWHVTIDGAEQPTFMVSPSYIGVEVPAGHRKIHAEYRSNALKKLLLVLGAFAVGAAIALRRRLPRLETRLLRRLPY